MMHVRSRAHISERVFYRIRFTLNSNWIHFNPVRFLPFVTGFPPPRHPLFSESPFDLCVWRRFLLIRLCTQVHVTYCSINVVSHVPPLYSFETENLENESITNKQPERVQGIFELKGWNINFSILTFPRRRWYGTRARETLKRPLVRSYRGQTGLKVE